MVSVSGYLIGSQEAEQDAVTAKGRARLVVPVLLRDGTRPRRVTRNTGSEFAKLIWQTASPKWRFDDATFERTAKAFDNPDHVSIVIHNYRWRLGLADGESKLRRSGEAACGRSRRSRCLPSRSRAMPMVLHTRIRARMRRSSPATYSTDLLNGGVGHNLPQEAARQFADAIIEVDRF